MITLSGLEFGRSAALIVPHRKRLINIQIITKITKHLKEDTVTTYVFNFVMESDKRMLEIFECPVVIFILFNQIAFDLFAKTTNKYIRLL